MNMELVKLLDQERYIKHGPIKVKEIKLKYNGHHAI